MLFNSIEYLLFLPLVFTLYWFFRHKLTQNAIVLVSSYIFYGCWDYRFLSLIVLSSLIDYFVGIYLSRTDHQKKRKALLMLSLMSNLGILVVFKYFNFFIGSFVDMMAMFSYVPSTTTLDIVLPVGISFYTFQTLSYTIDVYRRKIKVEKNWLPFFAYVSFFPQLVAGPIERAETLLPQFSKVRIFSYDQARKGCFFIMQGLFKKIVIADQCAYYVDYIFENHSSIPAPYVWLGVPLFAFQIYCDFSGYSDIAVGSAKLFGIDLMQNFKNPYFSRNIGEFWRRWHISLSTWFRDYLYIPLGGSRVGKSKSVRNVMIIFLVSGLWHGANWTYIVWGLLNAMYFLPSIILGNNRTYLGKIEEGKFAASLSIWFRIILTFSLVGFSWIYFRSDSIAEAHAYIWSALTQPVSLYFEDVFSSKGRLAVTLFMLTLFICYEWFTRDDYNFDWMECRGQGMRWAVIGFSLYCILFSYELNVSNQFIYFQF